MNKPEILAISSALLGLVSCANPMPIDSSSSLSTSSGTSVSSEEQEDFSFGSKVLFSEVYFGKNIANRAFEITNYGETSVDLSEFEVRIFHGISLSPEYFIPLSGTLEAGSSYIVKYGEATEDIPANLVSNDFINNGTWPMGLYQNGKRVDTLGTIGFDLPFAKGKTIIRKNERRIGREASKPYDWIALSAGNRSNLGSGVCPFSIERLNEGPHLTEEALNLPYCDEHSLGAGGAVEVTVRSYGDGDTTGFNLPSELSAYYGKTMRYQEIDTPETSHPGQGITAQPWGYAAANWNNAILRAAKHIRIQAVLGGGLTENFGRMLGFVWYTNEQNPKPSDYRLLNHQTLFEGFSKVFYHSDKLDNMYSDTIPFTSYIYDAEARAAELGLKVHGEIDPDFQ